MGKILSYSNNISGAGWIRRETYSTDDIRRIQDPNGGKAEFPRTAVPSPFAQIDLVANAFATLAASPDLKAAAAHTRLVSNALDIAQIFFDYSNHSDNIKITRWNPATQLEILENDRNHKVLGETLSLYFTSDADAYNFNPDHDWYILSFNNKVIGCTSPASYTFASPSASPLAEVQVEEGEILFSPETRDLWQRDSDFVVYLVHWFNAFPELRSRMRSVYDYILVNLEIARTERPELYRSVTARVENPGAINNSAAMTLADSLQISYESFSGEEMPRVLGFPLFMRKHDDILSTIRQSDFMLRPIKEQPADAVIPLILKTGFTPPGLDQFTYIHRPWRDSAKALTFGLPFNERKLPDSSFSYPWFTTSDFLEETLIELSMPIDSHHFFSPEVGTKAANGYLIPVKPLFFDYFPASFLTENVVPGKKVFEMHSSGSSVTAILRIPVKRSYVEFIRIYRRQPEGDWIYDEELNEGNISAPLAFSVGIFPFVRTGSADIYNVQLLELLRDFELSLTFNSDSDGMIPLRREPYVRSRFRSGSSTYYEIDQSFDYISVAVTCSDGQSRHHGIVVPLWPEYRPSASQFSFAVDFGTTNTHVEYSVDEAPPIPLAFSESHGATLMATLAAPGSMAQFESLAELEFVPRAVDGFYSFPMRTVIAENEENSERPEALRSANISFSYERKEFSRYKVSTYLKWADNTEYAEQFLRELMMLIRARVIISGGDLRRIRILYFYPVSMKKSKLNRFLSLWEALFTKYITTDGSPKVMSLPESVAPAYFYRDAARDGSSFVSVDIGGGTTDVVVYRSDLESMSSRIESISSFRFAGNAIFGDGFVHADACNSILVSRYSEYFSKIVNADPQLAYLDVILSDILKTKRSEDINAFLFSIENSGSIKSLPELDRRRFSYNAMLADDDELRPVFLYFFSSIIYYVAKMMLCEGLEMPKQLYFSGTGSKILNILGRKESVTVLAKEIIEKVYGRNYGDIRFTMRMEREAPKQVTCKGGLELLRMVGDDLTLAREMSVDGIALRRHNFTLTGHPSFTTDSIRSADAKGALEKSVIEFNAFFNDLFGPQMREEFGVDKDILDRFIRFAGCDIPNYLIAGINAFLPLSDVSDEPVEDVPFFYPLIGIIRGFLRSDNS